EAIAPDRVSVETGSSSCGHYDWERPIGQPVSRPANAIEIRPQDVGQNGTCQTQRLNIVEIDDGSGFGGCGAGAGGSSLLGVLAECVVGHPVVLGGSVAPQSR